MIIDERLPRLKWQGARTAAVSACVGCIFFFIVEFGQVYLLNPSEGASSVSTTVFVFIIAVIFGSLLSLIPALIGGYFLAAILLTSSTMDRHARWKAILVGVILGIITVSVIYVISFALIACSGHAVCNNNKSIVDIFSWITSFYVRNSVVYQQRFILAFLIAGLAGAWTGKSLVNQWQPRST
jgi:hypothetical protein